MSKIDEDSSDLGFRCRKLMWDPGVEIRCSVCDYLAMLKMYKCSTDVGSMCRNLLQIWDSDVEN